MYSWKIFDLMERLIGSEYARSQVELATGQAITDLDGDGMPDSQPQIRAAFDYIVKREILLDESTPSFTPTQVHGSLFHDPAGRAHDAFKMLVGLPGTREQTAVSSVQQAVESDLEFLKDVPSNLYGRTDGLRLYQVRPPWMRLCVRCSSRCPLP